MKPESKRMKKLDIHRVNQYRKDHNCSLKEAVRDIKKRIRMDNLKRIDHFLTTTLGFPDTNIRMAVELLFEHIKALEDLQ